MKITVTSKPVESGKGWLKYAIITVLVVIITLGVYVAMNNKLIAPVVLTTMAMVLVALYGSLLMWMSKSIDTMRKVYHAYNTLGKEMTQLTSLTRDLHEVLTNVIRLAEYAPSNLVSNANSSDTQRLEMENAPESNVEEWSLPTDDTVIPIDRRFGAS